MIPATAEEFIVPTFSADPAVAFWSARQYWTEIRTETAMIAVWLSMMLKNVYDA